MVDILLWKQESKEHASSLPTGVTRASSVVHFQLFRNVLFQAVREKYL